jgi:hypothetical protein
VLTTLNKIKDHSPCVEGWKTLLKGLNKLEADDEPLHLLEILRINGAEDALWALRTFSKEDCQIFAVGAARQVQHLWAGAENVLDMAEAYVLKRPVNGVNPPSLEGLNKARSMAAAAAAWAAWAGAAGAAAAAAWAATRAGAAWAAAEAWVAAEWAAAEWEGASKEELIKISCAYVESRNG